MNGLIRQRRLLVRIRGQGRKCSQYLNLRNTNRQLASESNSSVSRFHAVLFWLFLLVLNRFLLPETAFAADASQIVSLFRSGKYAECVDAATQAIAENEYSGVYRLWKVRAEMELGRYADAAKTLDLALKRFPNAIDLRWHGREVFRFNNDPQRVKLMEDELLQLARQTPWQYSDASVRIDVGRFLLSQGGDPKQILEGIYNVVKKQQPSYTGAFLASGELALEKGDFALAAQAFEQVVKLDAADPDAHFGVARSYAPSDDEKAETALKAALERNPNHISSLLMLVEGQIDSERYDDAETLLTKVTGVNLHHPLAAAYRAVLAHLRNEPEAEQRYHDHALRFWKTNPEVDHLIGKKLSQKYRFAEGAKYQRQALALDAKYLPAKMQLAQDLMRLGDEEEGWKLAEEVYAADGYNVLAHNLVTLQDSLSKFRTLEDDGFLLRMESREADLYGRRALDLLKRARTHLCAKYAVTLDGPVIVEMFPKQQDFAIRTFGLPGGAGFLGVCFGTVITANSPASQGAHPTCWEATLWHEFCHVVTLNKTKNKMPRWLSEGISVYEECLADPAWGQTITPQYRSMLLGDELTPVSKLSGAFLNPPSPRHLQFAYLESSLVVQYLVETHGLDALQSILADLGKGMTINDALARHTTSLDELDAAFAKYARQKAEALAPQADWSEPELPRRADSKTIAAWLKDHPHNYQALLRLATQLIAEEQWTAALEPLATMQKLYPQDAGADSLHPLLARVHRELKQNQIERSVLERYATLSDDDVDMFARLTELTSQSGDWELTKKHALRWLAVDPLQPAPHRRAAEAAEHLRDDALAIGSYRALLLLNPIDTADLHLRLATALQRTGDLAAARRHALFALEETPRFRAAHQRLLGILKEIEAREKKSTNAF